MLSEYFLNLQALLGVILLCLLLLLVQQLLRGLLKLGLRLAKRLNPKEKKPLQQKEELLKALKNVEELLKEEGQETEDTSQDNDTNKDI